MATDDGGLAFPMPDSEEYGMSLRDVLVAHSITGILSGFRDKDHAFSNAEGPTDLVISIAEGYADEYIRRKRERENAPA